ncbi:hypothetical protein Ciccas_003872, partial [Cichlidogyrus casuarinus]
RTTITHFVTLYSSFVKKVHAINAGLDGVSFETSTKVTVRIQDENDNAPAFLTALGESCNITVPENAPLGTSIGTISAVDIDRDSKPGFIKYSITGFAPRFSHSPWSKSVAEESLNPFAIDAQTGELRTIAVVDREKVEAFDLTITAEDYGQAKSLTSTGHFVIRVLDENDNAPQWIFPGEENNEIQVGEEVTHARVLTRVKAEDRDSGMNGRVHYTIGSMSLQTADGMEQEMKISNFALLEKSGFLFRFNHSQIHAGERYKLILLAQDRGDHATSSVATLFIKIIKGSASPMPRIEEQLFHSQSKMYNSGEIGMQKDGYEPAFSTESDLEAREELREFLYNARNSLEPDLSPSFMQWLFGESSPATSPNPILLLVGVPVAAVLLCFSVLLFSVICLRKRIKRRKSLNHRFEREMIELKEPPDPGLSYPPSRVIPIGKLKVSD